MRRKNVTFVGNCQASAICTLYREFIGVPAGEDVVYFNDHDLRGQDVLDGVADADLVIVQDRDFHHELTPEAVPHAAFQAFPMVMAAFLWPFANEAHVRNEPQPPFSDGPYPSQLGDSYLNRLIAEGVAPEAALEQYLALDIGKVAHLDRLAELYMERQQERDARTGFDIAPVIEAEFRHQHLFRTPHHPNAMLFGIVARQLFERLGAPPETIDAAIGSLDRSPFPSDELPIHPGVIKHFALTFADETTRYTYFDEGKFTFDEFALRYMRYDHNQPLRTAIATIGSENPVINLARIEEGLRASPGSLRGWRIKGELLDRLGRHQEADDAFTHAISLDPEDAEGHIAWARSLVERGHGEEAERAARRAVALAPRYASSQQVLAEVLLRTGARDEAHEAAREAVRLVPGRTHLYQQLGIALLRNGDMAEAEAAARQAMTMNPEEVDHRNLLAEIYEAQGRRQEAIALLNDGGGRNAQSFSLLGNFHWRDNNYVLAEEAFDQGVQRDPSRADLVACLATMRDMRQRQQ